MISRESQKKSHFLASGYSYGTLIKSDNDLISVSLAKDAEYIRVLFSGILIEAAAEM